MSRIISKREFAGWYEISIGDGLAKGEKVDVKQIRKADGADHDFWVAHAAWSHHLFSDGMRTKREAVECAVFMLREREAQIIERSKA